VARLVRNQAHHLSTAQSQPSIASLHCVALKEISHSDQFLEKILIEPTQPYATTDVGLCAAAMLDQISSIQRLLTDTDTLNPTVLTGHLQRSAAPSSQLSAAACRHLRYKPVAPIATWLSAARGMFCTASLLQNPPLRLEFSTQPFQENFSPMAQHTIGNPDYLTRRVRSLTALFLVPRELVRASSAPRQTVMHVSTDPMGS